MNVKQQESESFISQVRKALKEDVDFSYDIRELEIEYCIADKMSWEPLTDNIVNSICNALKREFGDEHSPEFIKAMLGAEAYQIALKEFKGSTHEEKMAEILLSRINERMGPFYEFRYNVTTKKIEYKDGGCKWKEISHYFLINIRDEISSYEVKYSWEEVRACFINAPSIRFEEQEVKVLNDQERYADNVIFDITCRLSRDENFEFRYNTKTDEIEYDREFANEWKIADDKFLNGIYEFLLFDGDVYPVEDLKMLLKTAPSIRYEPKN